MTTTKNVDVDPSTMEIDQTNKNVDQTNKDVDSTGHIETTTVSPCWTDTLQDHERLGCMKTKSLAPTHGIFKIVLSRGEGVIIHSALFHQLPLEDQRIHIGNLKKGTMPAPTAEDPDAVSPTFSPYTISIPSMKGVDMELQISGEAYMTFAARVDSMEWTHFKVKTLVTSSELPYQKPNNAPEHEPLMWIGVGEDANESLLSLSNNPAEPKPEDLTSDLWFHATGEFAASDDEESPESK